MQRVVFYARVSTEEEKQQNALKKQKNELIDLIKSTPGWVLVGEYTDEGKSGTTTEKRDDYNRMLFDIAKDKFDIVVAKDLSRLNRNERNWYNLLYSMDKFKIKLFIALDNKFIEKEDQLIAGFQNMMNAQRSRELSQKMLYAHKSRIKNKDGIVTNGKMWGYKQEKGDGRPTIREDEAEVIRKIFFLYTEKDYGIRRIINELEIPESIIERRKLINGKIAHTTIERIIKNPAYMGQMAQNKISKDFDTKKISIKSKDEWVYFDCPAIISEETFKKAQVIRKVKTSDKCNENRGKYAGRYPLSGKLICSICGSKYTHISYPSPNQANIWECQTYKEQGPSGCNNVKIKVDELNEIVKSAIFSTFNKKSEAADILFNAIAQSLKDSDFSKSLKEIEHKVKKINQLVDGNYDMRARQEKTLERFKYDKIRYETALQELTEQKNAILEKQQTTMSTKDRLQNFKDIIYSEKAEITDDVIKENVNKIVVFPDKLRIYLNIGFKNDPENKYYFDFPSVPPAGSDRPLC